MKKIANMISLLESLAQKIEKDWSKTNFSLDSFAQICEKNLLKLESFSPPTLIELNQFVQNNEVPKQFWDEANFSDFPFTVINKERFFIDLYYWFHSDTTIHNHHFCGGFKLLEGSSLQFTYLFEPIKQIDDSYWYGDIKTAKTENLKIGSVQRIDFQDAFIHKVFHTSPPTVTLCVRTPQVDGASLWNFVPPHHKILTRNFSIQQKKWYHSMKNIFMYQSEQSPQTFSHVPFAAGDILRIIIQSNNGDTPLNPLQEKLLEYIQNKGVALDFYEHLQRNYKADCKIRAFEKDLK